MGVDAGQKSGEFQEGMPPAADAGLFGLDIQEKDAALVLIPVPWDATTSYGRGTAGGPQGIVKASHQLDLEDLSYGSPWTSGILMDAQMDWMPALNEETTRLVEEVREASESHGDTQALLNQVNLNSEKVDSSVEARATELYDQGKIVGVVGGDHSSPLGMIRAAAKKFGSFGILHFDAHFDLRDAYEGFKGSHASIMHNVLDQCPEVTKLVQVGIRDFCEAERKATERQADRIKVFYDQHLFKHKALGHSFDAWVQKVIAELPEKVWISFDIDGLSAAYGPSTGTPVPGGLSYAEAQYLIEQLAFSGRTIVGFDLCEVSPDVHGSEWDLNVGARVLYKLCGACLHTQKSG